MAKKQGNFTLLGGLVNMRHGFYNPTSDAVWLAAFAAGATGSTVLDVGIGTGGIALCMLQHNPKLSVTGIDISDQMLKECTVNAELNSREIELINADIMTWRTSRTFDIVVSNPPYFRGTPSARHSGAHHNADIVTWVHRCVARVRPRGTFFTIVDSAVLSDVISAMQKSCGDITILPLFGARNVAERVLLSGRVGTRGGTILHNGLQMNNEMVLRDGLTINQILARLGQI